MRQKRSADLFMRELSSRVFPCGLLILNASLIVKIGLVGLPFSMAMLLASFWVLHCTYVLVHSGLKLNSRCWYSSDFLLIHYSILDEIGRSKSKCITSVAFLNLLQFIMGWVVYQILHSDWSIEKKNHNTLFLTYFDWPIRMQICYQ